MRVLIVSTSERTGGAAVAASRLLEALQRNGVKAKMLVRDKQTQNPSVVSHPRQLRLRLAFLWERFCIWLHLGLRRQRLFELDIANSGADITRLPEFLEADVIHLHWVNQGMLSLRQIRRILDSGKRVVWTMHDVWPATAICHLTLDCPVWASPSQRPPLAPPRAGEERPPLSPPRAGEERPPLSPPLASCMEQGAGRPSCRLNSRLARQVWQRKQAMLQGSSPITFVACSQWLAGEARKSRLLQGQNVLSIPNPIDTSLYKPGSRRAARQSLGLPLEGKVVLFVAQRATNPYKGMHYLAEALTLMQGDEPPLLAVLGSQSEDLSDLLPLREGRPGPVGLGYITDERRMVMAYQAADVFVLPSLSENLPNTIMEAMACGVPCVGFRVGGIPEEIDHLQTGYVADYKDAASLARGLRWVLYEADAETLSKACVQKVQRCYSQQSVARRYLEVYNAPQT